MKHILVALDHARSDHALERAAQLATEHNAESMLIYIAPTNDLKNVRAALERIQHKLQSYRLPSGARVSYRIGESDPATEIASLARSTEAALIILGLHHDRPLLGSFVNPPAHRIARHGLASVLVAKERVEGPYRRVLAATDFSPSARRAFRAALQMALRAEFFLLHVYQTPFPAFIRFRADELEEFQAERLSRIQNDLHEEEQHFQARSMKRAFPRVNVILERNDVDAGISKIIRHLMPDLLVMGVSGFDFATMTASRTRQYLTHPIGDVLCVA